MDGAVPRGGCARPWLISYRPFGATIEGCCRPGRDPIFLPGPATAVVSRRPPNGARRAGQDPREDEHVPPPLAVSQAVPQSRFCHEACRLYERLLVVVAIG